MKLKKYFCKNRNTRLDSLEEDLGLSSRIFLWKSGSVNFRKNIPHCVLVGLKTILNKRIMISPQMVINYLDMKPGASSCSLARLRAAGLTASCFLSHLLETHLWITPSTSRPCANSKNKAGGEGVFYQRRPSYPRASFFLF